MTHQWCYKTLKERKDTTSTDLPDDDDDDDEVEVVPNFTCFLETCIRLFSEETRGSCDAVYRCSYAGVTTWLIL